MSHLMGNSNKRQWSNKKVVKGYESSEGLQKAEHVIFSLLKEDFRDKAILDIGVGCGRTTPYLINISKNYIGIDYSPEMIEGSRRKYPDVEFLTRDARNMSSFHDHQFDFAVFSYNGIDQVSHQDRLQILHEIYRVLQPNGVLVFSSHNLDSELRSAFDLRNIRFSTDPIRLLKRTVAYFLGIGNHIHMKKHELHEANYSILNDCANNYSLLMYYITMENQIAQLKEVGFHEVTPVNMDGEFLDVGIKAPDPWIYYLARK